MSVYLDASVLVAFFSLDPFSVRADQMFRGANITPVVSSFAMAEFSSAIARRVRMQDLTREDASTAFGKFDTWVASGPLRCEVLPADIQAADRFVRRLDLALRVPDALHLAIAQRIGAELATFDTRMAENAKALGVALAPV